ncbi:MAG: flavodoxin-dependent (E)-4-hydroxy-3-methylbut-2-enyl-diphosphate synthase [Planctomycetes bacterium]|nr:flavodoxin-dependent (E)-4-hydroxy-3-methylbut-2-enyl-diphosphate synthase [Planctomycetota bacterium]
MDLSRSERRATVPVRIGSLVIGSGHPIRVQSMTTTDTADLDATLAQIRSLEEAGCELIRVTVPNRAAAANLKALRAAMHVPLIADVHFDFRMALLAIEAGASKVRVNPGNIGSKERVREILRAARAAGTAVRVGVNSGSVEKDLLKKHGWPSPQALVESALRHLETCREEDFDQVVVSIKSTDVRTCLAANRLLAASTSFPLHLGITEAGLPGYGAIKSAIGIGALLAEGIGDTIRVSLTCPPVVEIPVAFDILKAAGARVTSPELISCPTCGRIDIDLEKLMAAITERLRGETLPIRIAVLGCPVNGPGEAAEADIGIAGGGGMGVLYRKGKAVRKVREEEMVDALLEEIENLKREGAPGGEALLPNDARPRGISSAEAPCTNRRTKGRGKG